MTINLTVGATVLELPPDLYWEDEFGWHPVEQSAERTITGGLVLQYAARTTGRPITLRPYEQTCAWMPATTLQQLQTWAATPGVELELLLRGVTRTVVFRHQDTAIEAEPVLHFDDLQPGDFYLATLRFMTVD
jgi:hypothetical protein